MLRKKYRHNRDHLLCNYARASGEHPFLLIKAFLSSKMREYDKKCQNRYCKMFFDPKHGSSKVNEANRSYLNVPFFSLCSSMKVGSAGLL